MLKNTLYSFLSAVLVPLLLLLATPFLLNSFGEHDYGVFVLVSTIISTLMIFNFGIGEATVKFTSSVLNEPDKLRNSITIILGICLCVLLILTSSLFVVSFSVDIRGVLGLSKGDISIALIIVVFSLKLLQQQIFSIFKGMLRFDWFSLLFFLDRLGFVLIALLIGYLHLEVETIFQSYLLVMILSIIFSLRVVINEIKGLRLPKIEISFLKSFFRFSVWGAGIGICGVVSQNADKLIVANKFSMEELAIYSISVAIISQIHSIKAISLNWVFPYFSNKSKNIQEILPIFYTLFLLSVAISLAGVVLFFLYGDLIIEVWLGAELFEKFHEYLLPTSVCIFLMLISVVPYYTLNGLGFVKANYYAGLMEVVTFFIIIFIFRFESAGDLLYARSVSKLIAVLYSLQNIARQKCICNMKTV